MLELQNSFYDYMKFFPVKRTLIEPNFAFDVSFFHPTSFNQSNHLKENFMKWWINFSSHGIGLDQPPSDWHLLKSPAIDYQAFLNRVTYIIYFVNDGNYQVSISSTFYTRVFHTKMPFSPFHQHIYKQLLCL